MARTIRNQKLDTRSARAKLRPRKGGYWAAISRGCAIGYRKGAKGGVWLAKIVRGKFRRETTLGIADDVLDADGVASLDFSQAQEKARTWFAKQARSATGLEERTVLQALDDYEADLKTRKGDAHNAKRVRKHLPADVLPRPITSLDSGELRRWRDRLRKTMAPASVNRTVTGLKAALNLAADSHGIETRPWAMLKAIPDAEEARNVILADGIVRQIVDKSYLPTVKAAAQIKDQEARAEAEQYAHDFAQAFGLFVEVAATTGARPIQLSRLAVEDLTARGEPRLLMPSSRKGKGTKAVTRRPVPIPADLALRLRAHAAGRAKTAPLLMKPGGSPWSKSDHSRPFARAAKAAGLDPDEVTIYALRHSSIVRQLLAGVPIRVVASGHDTSVAMIEKTYSRYISDHADALVRATVLDMAKGVEGKVAAIGGDVERAAG